MAKKRATRTEDQFGEWVPIDSIQRYEKNPRKNEEAVASVAASIREYGWQQPIVVDENGVIIAGDTRYQAAGQLGEKQVPIRRAIGLTDEQKRAYRIADNATGEVARWEDALLAEELEGVTSADAELRKLFADLCGEPDEDEEYESEQQAVGMALLPHEHFDYVVILARTSDEWKALCERLGIGPSMFPGRTRGRIGTGRAISAGKALELLKAPEKS